MLEVTVLFVLALIWIAFATIEDLRTREIANWLNFSLVIFALGFRFFYSLFERGEFSFFYQGVIGFLLFFALGNLFYYGKMFAGGDAKLMMSLGAILPIYSNFFDNVSIFFLFLFLFLVIGALYGFCVSFYFGLKNYKNLKKEIRVQFEKKKKFILLFLVFASILLILGFFIEGLIYFGLLLFIFPYFYLYLKSVDEVCMVKEIAVTKLTVGDWLYKDLRVGGKKIKASWDGLSKKEIKFLKKHKKKIIIRYGIQFAPVFLISFILFWIILEFDFFGLIIKKFGF